VTQRPSPWTIALMFVTIASTAFGGGQKAQIRRATVERGWLTDDEFVQAIEIVELMPGANLVNLAVYIGERLGGPMGAVAGFLGVTITPFVIVLLVGWWYFSPYNVPALRGALAGCAAGAIGLTLANALELTTSHLRKPIELALIGLTALSVAVWHMHLLVLIAVMGGLGIANAVLATRKTRTA
jgi:chromate transporter